MRSPLASLRWRQGGGTHSVLIAWWLRRSLRARLTVAATVVIAVALCAAAAALTARLHSVLQATADANARQRLEQVVGTLRAADATGPLPPIADPGVVVQIIGQRGTVVAASPNVDGRPRLFPSDPPPGRVAIQTSSRLPVPDSADSYRVAAQMVSLGGARFLVYAAVPADGAGDSVATLLAAFAVGLPMVVLVLATVTWLLVGRALRPVERLRRQAADITATDLHSRLDVPASDDELSRLAATLNDLLSRIEESTRRQREFVADAAHELRSPLTSLRTQLEVAAGEPEPHLSREDLSGLLADASRLSRLVDDLLHLARLDARPQLRLRPVDLDDIVLSEARRARARAAPAVAVDTAAVSAGQVLGDADALTRMVRNLLDNATRYARSQVTLTLQTGGTDVVLAIWDDGAGIPRTARERIFSRFTRLDDSRTHRDDQAGVGLGLAIVRGVVTAHGGTVDVTDRADALPGAHFQVRLPVGPT